MKRYAAILLSQLTPQLSMTAAGLADIAKEDEGLPLVMLVVLLGFACMVLAGMVVCAIIAGIILLLGAMGIVSLSLLVGWYQRSFTKGIKVFVQLCFAAAGGGAGLLLLLLLDVFRVSWVSSTLFCIIAGAGVVAGWVCSLIAIQLAKLVFAKLEARYR